VNVDPGRIGLAQGRLDAARICVSAIGTYLPPTIETHDVIARKTGKSEQWILERAGVRSRHIAEEQLPAFAAKAAQPAIEKAGKPDLLINASATPYQTLPDNSAFISAELGIEGIPCFSIHASCLSFLVALKVAAGFLSSSQYGKILVVSAEIATPARNFQEPESASLLGDGAAAVMFERPHSDRASGLLAWRMATYPSGIDLTEVRGGGLRNHPLSPSTSDGDYLFSMKGPPLFRLAASRLPAFLENVLTDAGLSLDDIDVVIPHQASGLAMSSAARMLGIPNRKIVRVIENQGNCVAASLPLTLAAAQSRGLLIPGARALLIGTGAGVSIGAAIIRW
jgi:3-oxoacyl-[acyl-carrier-protein] synthase III